MNYLKKGLIVLVLLGLVSLPVIAERGNGSGSLRLDSFGREKTIVVGGVGTAFFEGRGVMIVKNVNAEICDIEGDAVITWTGYGSITEPIIPNGCKSYLGLDTIRVEGSHFSVNADTMGEKGQLAGTGSGYINLEGTGWYIY